MADPVKMNMRGTEEHIFLKRGAPIYKKKNFTLRGTISEEARAHPGTTPRSAPG